VCAAEGATILADMTPYTVGTVEDSMPERRDEDNFKPKYFKGCPPYCIPKQTYELDCPSCSGPDLMRERERMNENIMQQHNTIIR